MAAKLASRYIFFDPFDYEDEPFLLNAAPESLGVAYNSLKRYARIGKESVTGEMVRLEVCLLPGGLATTQRAWRKFIGAINGKVT